MKGIKDNSPKYIYKRVQGGALYFAIFVMLLLSMLCLLLLSYFELSFKEDTVFIQSNHLSQNLASAATFISCQPELVTDNHSVSLDLFEDGHDIVKADMATWGMLKKLTLLTEWKKIKKQSTLLMAEKAEKRCALWMPDNKKYVSLIGNSYIQGDCYLSALGIRKGNAEGRYFEGPFLHNGNINVSGDKMPQVRKVNWDFITHYLKGDKSKIDSLVAYSKQQSKKEIQQSFRAKTLLLHSTENISLTNKVIRDNVIVYSPDTIVLWPSSKVLDAILIARVIDIKPGVQSRLQAFASRELRVGKNTTLSYPSFVGSIGASPEVSVTLDENTHISGGVICYSLNPQESKTKLEIAKGSQLHGKVYVNGDLSFSGEVYGSLYCKRFVHSTPRAFYENFLFDGVIDESKLPAAYTSFCLDNEPVFKLREVKQCP